MLDFTSALYLGLRHASGSLRPWAQLTTGLPAALAAPPAARRLAGELAELTGTEQATVARSTLHAFWDLFAIVADRGVAVYVDRGAYPILRWGADRAACRGIAVHAFRHHDPLDLEHQLRRAIAPRRRPLVVTDGFCPGCGRAAPLRRYLDLARRCGGQLALDDTQALGLLGRGAEPAAPYGFGGGGSLRHHGLRGPDILVVSSLAKGFGVPMAMVAGSAETIGKIDSQSETRAHCSPPSNADLHAAEHALAVNRRRGDALRRRLVHLVRRFADGLRRLGLLAGNSLFPVQRLALPSTIDAPTVHERLLRLGVRAVLHRASCSKRLTVSFLIRAHHREREIDHALLCLRRAIGIRRASAGSAPSREPVAVAARWR